MKHTSKPVRSHRKTAFICVSLALPILLCSCSGALTRDDLAVAKMPTQQIQATAFLPLNADKPGTPVQVERYLVPGKYNVVMYSSPYAQNCAAIEQGLYQLVQSKNYLAVRTVNVNRPDVQGIDWESPIMEDLSVRELPYIRIYDPGLQLRANGRPAYEQVMAWLQGRSG